MTAFRRSRPSFLRTLAILVLALGVFVRPLALMSCELHSASLTLAQAGLSEQGAPDGTPELHTHGLHELVQQGLGGGAIDTVTPFVFSPVVYSEVRALHFDAIHVPPLHVAGPFRPPIA